ncbi:MAG: glycosyltransferase [Acidobacteria bacterium]|nr:glycosyltransferase [Acidobacteriota bacterium]
MFADRILLVHNHYRQPGGEDRVFADELELLSKSGHEVIRFTADNATITRSGGLALATGTIWNAGRHKELVRLLEEKKPRLMHVHNTFPLLSPAVYYAARSRGTAVVQTLHNYRLLCPGATFFRDGAVCVSCLGRALPWPAVAHGCYRTSRCATAAVAAMVSLHRAIGTWRDLVSMYIAPSEFVRRKFEEAGFPRQKLTVKPNFLPRDPGAASGRGGFGLFVGRLAGEKGLLTLLQAWRRLGGAVSLRIVGEGPWMGEVLRESRSLPSAEVLGTRSIDEVYRLMGEAAFLVFPSEWHETFGLVAIEAFARGTPVIASDIGAISELVEHGRTGLLFRPGDAEDLAAKVEWFLSHPTGARQMRAEARAEFLAKYTAERNYSALMEIYRRAIEGRGAVLEPQAAAAQAAGHAG